MAVALQYHTHALPISTLIYELSDLLNDASWTAINITLCSRCLVRYEASDSSIYGCIYSVSYSQPFVG